MTLLVAEIRSILLGVAKILAMQYVRWLPDSPAIFVALVGEKVYRLLCLEPSVVSHLILT